MKRVLILTSSGGTAHDVSAYAIQEWLAVTHPGLPVLVDHVLERSSFFYRATNYAYNTIQKKALWMHRIFWWILELEDLIRLGTVTFGRSYFLRLIQEFRPDLIVSTHPHINRGYFAFAKTVLGSDLRCVVCCTELDGGYGFSRNWFAPETDRFFALTPGVARALRGRGMPSEKIVVQGPLLAPAFYGVRAAPDVSQLPLLVLGSGANGANNHALLLGVLRALAGRIRVAVLCGRRQSAYDSVSGWAARHPELELHPLAFQGPSEMARLYQEAWAFVARPGARTASEALALGCPLIFNCYGITMPQETQALRFFKELGILRMVNQPVDLMRQLSFWLSNPEAYRHFRDACMSCNFGVDPHAYISQLMDG